MFKKGIYILISIFFNTVKFIKIRILKWGYGDTFSGYLLEKIPYDFLKDFFNLIPAKYIFITGTNGKTSTTALTVHILSNLGFTVYSNKTGSNLYRGILSFFALNFIKFINKSPKYIVLELDEGSVSKILQNFPKNKHFSFILLNISRDQLDRYGEIDILLKNIYSSLTKFTKKTLILNTNDKNISNFKSLKSDLPLSKCPKDLVNLLGISEQPHLIENLSFILTLLNNEKISVLPHKLSKFSFVPGRGSIYVLNNTFFEVHLTKNPKSFNNNLSILLKNKKIKNVLILVNDYIPDGRDVSWFFDIDEILLIKALKDKNIFVGGSRSYDFCNMLMLYKLPCINLYKYNNYKYLSFIFNISNFFVLSNYSATQQVLKYLKNESV